MRRLLKLAFRLCLAAFVLAILSAALFVAQPTLAPPGTSTARSDPEHLRRHVEMLATTLVPRDLKHPKNHDAAADYILDELRGTNAVVSEQPYVADRVPVRNVIARFGPVAGPPVVVGAHYDAFGGLPGADDNASGVAGLLELARLLGERPPAGPVELVTYTLEEPPYTGSALMGSAVHAASLEKRGVHPRAMLALEMIGTFSDAAGSQLFPVPAMTLLYPRRGNFLAITGRPEDWRLTRRVKRAMRRVPELPIRSFNAPPEWANTDLSDHASYWKLGMPALLVTDTAFYRNPRYHTPEDKPEKLDYPRMALVVSAVFEAVRELAR